MKSKTRQQLAHEYGISVKTFGRWLKSKGIDIPQGIICPADLAKIYEVFGKPTGMHQ